ncbi:hypothetical protein EBU99_14380 [bacterium]|nr:hypothetical protein [bacterium]
MKMPTIALFFLCLLSCSKSSEKFDSASSIDGTWSRACEAVDPTTSSITKMKFQKGEVTMLTSFFGDSYCSNEFLNFELKTIGSAAVGGKIANGTANELNFANLKTSLTIKNDLFVAGANSEKLFGRSGWSKNVDVDITGKDSDGDVDLSFAKKIYDIVAASNNILCFGLDVDDQTATSVAKRPTTLDTDCFFRGEFMASTQPARNTLRALEGTWQNECDEDDSSSISQIVTISGTGYESKVTSYSDGNCTPDKESFVTRLTATIDVGANTIRPSGATELDIVQTKTFLMPKSASVVSAFNSANSYGFSNWALNVEKDISGKNPDGTPDSTTNIYDIFKIIGNSLCFGVAVGQDDGSTANKRFTFLENDCLEEK